MSGELLRLSVDPRRADVEAALETGIAVRALQDGRWGSHDIALLDRASLERWLDSEGPDFPKRIVLTLLGHPSSFLPGDRVRYVPGHAEDDLSHPDIDRGVVTSVSTDASTVFVWFGDAGNSKACSRDSLVSGW